MIPVFDLCGSARVGTTKWMVAYLPIDNAIQGDEGPHKNCWRSVTRNIYRLVDRETHGDKASVVTRLQLEGVQEPRLLSDANRN